MADTAARHGSISPLESGRTPQVTFRNILRGTFLVPSSNNKRSRGVLSQSYITWYRAIWARGRVGKRPRWVDFNKSNVNVFKMMRALNRAPSHLLQALVCELEEHQVCCSVTSSLCPSVSQCVWFPLGLKHGLGSILLCIIACLELVYIFRYCFYYDNLASVDFLSTFLTSLFYFCDSSFLLVWIGKEMNTRDLTKIW